MSNRTCSFPGCEKKHKGLGLCNAHYGQYRAGKTLRALSPRALPVRDRFNAYVERTDYCWNWLGSLNDDGYGSFRMQSKYPLAHRAAFEFAYGKIPEQMEIDHRCHNRACVNPDHLRLATTKQNNENLGGLTKANITGFRGVYRRKNGRFQAYVGHNKKKIHLGFFDTPEEAGEAARLKRLELFTHNNLDR